jgi:uncharacterized membrane protein
MPGWRRRLCTKLTEFYEGIVLTVRIRLANAIQTEVADAIKYKKETCYGMSAQFQNSTSSGCVSPVQLTLNTEQAAYNKFC